MSFARIRRLAFCTLLLGSLGGLQAQTSPAGSPDFFELKIRPVLAANCYSCHTNSQLGDLRVDSGEALLKGGKRGPALTPGDPDASLLIRAVKQTDADLKCPWQQAPARPDRGPVAWVKAGAAWPKAALPCPLRTPMASSLSRPSGNSSSPSALADLPAPPAVKDPVVAHCHRPVRSRASRTEGLKPVKAAGTRSVAARRPPCRPPEEIAPSSDPAPDLRPGGRPPARSPRYGERWGRSGWMSPVTAKTIIAA